MTPNVYGSVYGGGGGKQLLRIPHLQEVPIKYQRPSQEDSLGLPWWRSG